MSNIDNLIAALCPAGVPSIRLGDVAQYIRGVTYSKSQEQMHGPNRILRANNISLGNALDLSDVRTVSSEVLIKASQRLHTGDILMCAASGSKSHVGKVAYIQEDMNYAFGGFMAVVRIFGAVEARYLFHCLTSQKFSDYLAKTVGSSTINNLNAGLVENFVFQLPPAEVQREIVRILDAMTSLQAELQAELAARQKQYEYYRDTLLTFDKPVTPPREVDDIG